jgi:hypothetical protein
MLELERITLKEFFRLLHADRDSVIIEMDTLDKTVLVARQDFADQLGWRIAMSQPIQRRSPFTTA